MNQLPKFDQVISIEVSVASIYNKLLETFPEDYKHKEILSHAIVGSSIERGSISYIYNALNGYTNDVDFQIGELIMSKSKDRKIYKMVEESIKVGEKPKMDWDWAEIGECKVVEINMYSSAKLNVEYQQADENGKLHLKRSWVDHKKCTKLGLITGNPDDLHEEAINNLGN